MYTIPISYIFLNSCILKDLGALLLSNYIRKIEFPIQYILGFHTHTHAQFGLYIVKSTYIIIVLLKSKSVKIALESMSGVAIFGSETTQKSNLLTRQKVWCRV